MTHDQIKAPALPFVAGVEGLLQPKAQFIGSFISYFCCIALCALPQVIRPGHGS